MIHSIASASDRRFPGLARVLTGLFAAPAMLAFASPALAAPALQAVPETPVSSARSVVVDDVAWRCGPSGCVAGESNSRAAMVCARTARKLGALSSFSAQGRAFDAAQLAQCNAKANDAVAARRAQGNEMASR